MEVSGHLPFKIERFDVFEFDGVDHRLVQQTADGHLILERMDTGVTLQVKNKLDGGVGLPTVGWVLDMMRDFRLMFRKPALPNDAREKQRKIEIDNAELRKMDPRVDTRMSVVKHMDDNNIPMSDAKISAALDKLCTPEWMDKHKTRPGPSTVRLWMAVRGKPHDRRMNDMLSLKGASKRARKLHLTVLSVSSWHQLDYWTNPGLSIWDSWLCAAADIDRVNNGKVTSFGVQFPTPKEPFVCPSYETFRRGVNKLRDPDTFGAKFSKQAKESRTQGAGKPLRATAPGEIVTYDTWEMPLLFCVDGETGIPLGTPQFTNAMDVATKIMCGGVVECAPPTMSTIAQLILHTMSPKEVTPFFAEKKQYAGLAGVCLKPNEMLGDNALHHLAKAAEDNGMSAGISLRYAGKKKPRHKAFHERAYLTISTYVFNKIPGAKYDIKLMREYGYNPAEHKIVTIQQLRALTASAVDFYNTEDHDGLMSRPPLLVFNKLKAKYPLPAIYDLDQVRNAIGDVIYKVVLAKDGLTLWSDVRFGGIEAVNALLSDLMGTQYRRTQNATVEVKVKYNKNNIGSVRVWNPVRKFYVRLENLSIEGAEGMPLWQYERAREIAKAEKLAFHTPIERAYAREHVIKAARSVAAEVTAAGNRTLALLGMLPRVKEIIGEYIDIERITTSARDVEGTVPHDMADNTRLDATVEPRRSARRAEDPDRDPRDAAKPRQSRKSTNTATNTTTTGPRDAGGVKPNQAARPASGDWADFA